jgi:hypothetical protein
VGSPHDALEHSRLLFTIVFVASSIAYSKIVIDFLFDPQPSFFYIASMLKRIANSESEMAGDFF